MKRMVLAGGSGQMGTCIKEYFKRKRNANEGNDEREWDIIILSRGKETQEGNVRTVFWDGKTPGEWCTYLDGADVLINLAGKSVNCRYTEENKRKIIQSRTDSVNALSKAIAKCKIVPKLWMQAASATIYRHSEDRPMTERDGETGTGFSVEVCKAWEGIFNESTKDIQGMRKVILRTSLVLGKEAGVYPRLENLVRFGLGGKQGSGEQWVSWVHENDVARLTEWIIGHPEITGPVNCTSPQPISNKKFMEALRKVLGMPFGLPAPAWVLEIGAFIIGTETELILKSRWVLPEKLIRSGFVFSYPSAELAFKEIVGK